MNWTEAVEAMKAGHIVRQKSEMWAKELQPPDPGYPDSWQGAGILETGQEGCYLAHAWTVDEKAVQVFMGASSKVLFVPEYEHRSATDWVIVDRRNA